MLDFPDWRCCCLDRSAIILAGGSSNKFDCEKGQLQLNGKPLLNHVIDAVKDLVDEVVVVTNSQDRADTYAMMVSTKVRFAIDVCDSKGPLVGALTGFEAANGEYSYFCHLTARLFPETSCLCSLIVASVKQLLFQDGQTKRLNRYTPSITQNKH